jgi:thiosulfate/3-mercaptopyruvate sulfurtransferase
MSRFRHSPFVPWFVFGLAILCSRATAQARHDDATVADDSFIVSRSWLAQHLTDPSVIVLAVTHPPMDSTYASAHIPGARLLDYREVQATRNGLHTELPAPDTLRDLFERLGVSDATQVVLYGFPPMVARVWVTLQYLGHRRTAILDGGLAAWRGDGRSATSASPTIHRGHLTPDPHPEIVTDADWIMAHRGSPGVSLIDTRTDGEYLGTGERHGMPSAGHIPGAHQLQWEQLFTGDPGEGRWLPRRELARLYADRVGKTDTVVTYCWVGQRASVTYFVARMLGYPAKLYDGSYEDWQQRRLPVKSGSVP